MTSPVTAQFFVQAAQLLVDDAERVDAVLHAAAQLLDGQPPAKRARLAQIGLQAAHELVAKDEQLAEATARAEALAAHCQALKEQLAAAQAQEHLHLDHKNKHYKALEATKQNAAVLYFKFVEEHKQRRHLEDLCQLAHSTFTQRGDPDTAAKFKPGKPWNLHNACATALLASVQQETETHTNFLRQHDVRIDTDADDFRL
jgi:hypothetical protein